MPQLSLLRSGAVNLVVLVRICSGVVAVSRAAGELQFRAYPRPEPRPAPRGGARVIQLGLPAQG